MNRVAFQSRRLRAAIVSILGISLSGVVPAWAQPASNAKPANDVAALQKQLVDAFAELDKESAKIPAGSYDPQSLIEEVGREPQQLLEWVRDQTHWAPYRGALRGAGGVLQDRVGSSLDRALLLAEMIRAAGHDVRLANGTVADAGKVAAAIRPIPQNGMQLAKPEAASLTPEAKALAERLEKETAATRARTAAQADAILKTARPSPQPTADAAAVTALQDHWWVQVKQGEQWIDADPTLPTAKLADKLADARTTVAAPGDDGSLKSIPADLQHAVDMKIVVESLNNGKLTEVSPLNLTLRPAELQGKRVVVSHIPVAYKQKSDAPTAEQAKALTATTEFIPVIYVAGASNVNDAVTDAGQLNTSPNLDRTAGMSKAVGNAFGGLTGGGDSAPAGVWTAEWIEFTVRTPGKPTKTIRREVFDLIGPAARAAAPVVTPTINDAIRLDRALALVGETDVLAFGAQPTAEFLTNQYMQSLQKVKRRVLATVEARAAATDPKQPPKALDFDPARLSLSPVWGVATGRLTASPAAGDVYLDSTNIFCMTRRAHLDSSGKATQVRRTDLAVNDVAVRPGVDAFATRVKQGVADTVMEAVVIETMTSLAGAKEARAINTVNMLEAAGSAPVAINDASQLAAWPADARARAQQAIAGGATLLATAAPLPAGTALAGQVGWWKIDPATGTTIGVTGDGYHAATTERQTIENKVNGLLDIPFKITIEEMKSYTQAEFIQMVVGGKGLSGLQLLRAFQSAVRLHELILLL